MIYLENTFKIKDCPDEYFIKEVKKSDGQIIYFYNFPTFEEYEKYRINVKK